MLENVELDKENTSKNSQYIAPPIKNLNQENGVERCLRTIEKNNKTIKNLMERNTEQTRTSLAKIASSSSGNSKNRSSPDIQSLKHASTSFLALFTENSGQTSINTTNLPTLEEAKAVLAGKHILIVDDSSMIRRMTTLLLTKNGMTVDTANDGLEAFTKLSQGQKFDCVSMDIEMAPGMDGLTAIKKIREELRLNIPILVASANEIETYKPLALEAGANDFLQKPHKDINLFPLMANLIREKEEKSKNEEGSNWGFYMLESNSSSNKKFGKNSNDDFVNLNLASSSSERNNIRQTENSIKNTKKDS